MYKITFNTDKCCWEIKLLKCYCYWATLKGKTFPNHISAVDYVDQVGLNRVYRDWADSSIHHIMDGAR